MIFYFFARSPKKKYIKLEILEKLYAKKVDRFVFILAKSKDKEEKSLSYFWNGIQPFHFCHVLLFFDDDSVIWKFLGVEISKIKLDEKNKIIAIFFKNMLGIFEYQRKQLET